MSQKNQIDELFRSRLTGKGLEYAPEYWDQMESLLAIKRRKAIRRTIWLSSGFLLLVAAFLFTSLPEKEMRGLGDEEMRGLRDGEPALSLPKGSTTDLPEPTDNEEIRGLGDEETKGLGDLETRGHGDKENTSVHHLSGEPALSLPKGRITNMTELNMEEKPIKNQKSKIIIHKSEITGPLAQVPLASFKSHLTISAFPKTPLQQQTVKKVSLRPPYLINWYLEPVVTVGEVRHRTDQDVYNWKASTEKTQPFIQYSLNLRVNRGRFSLITGAGVLQWTERTNYTHEEDHYTFDTSYRLVSREFSQRPDGSYVALLRQEIDTTSHTTNTSVPCVNCPVTFRYLTVPVAVRYEFGRGKYLVFNEVGMTFSFLSKGSGEYSVERQNEIGKIPGMRTEQLSHRYLSPFVMQAGVALGMSYRIHPLVSINGKLAYQRSLTSMMNLYRQETDFYGIGIGMEWKLY